jgi:vacuolar-type H+-ATPase subunit E/Vma4
MTDSSSMRGVLGAMEKEIRAHERKAISEAQAFAKAKIREMQEKAKKDNSELFAMEKRNIEREMRREEEKIRERHLLGLVQAKELFVDKVWESAEKKFLSMPMRKKEYETFMGKILSSVKKTGEFEIYMRKEDRKFYSGAKQKAIAGGAVFRSKDGRVEIDNSLEGIAQRCREETRARIIAVLFDE